MNIEKAQTAPAKVPLGPTAGLLVTLPPSDVPKISEDRKPLKKRRVLITDLSGTEPKDLTPQPIELVRQVATYWETTNGVVKKNSEHDGAGNVRVSTISSKPGSYNYEEFYSQVKPEGDLARVRNPNVSDFKSLDVASQRTTKSHSQTMPPTPPIVELKKPPRRLDDDDLDEEEDIEEELNCLALSQGLQTLPRQRHCQLNSITPSPSFLAAAPAPLLNKNSPERVSQMPDKCADASDFDPIPWTSEPSCVGLIESTIDFLISMELDGSDSKSGKHEDTNFMTGTPLNSPTKKRVHFNPEANTIITITPRRSKQTTMAIPVRPSHVTMNDRPKSRIEYVMEDNPLFSPVKPIQLGQSSSAFSPKKSPHYFL